MKEGEVDRTSSSSSSRNKKPLWRNLAEYGDGRSTFFGIRCNPPKPPWSREAVISIFEFENLVVLVDVAKDIHLCSNLLSFVEVCCERSHLYALKVSAKVYTIGIYTRKDFHSYMHTNPVRKRNIVESQHECILLLV